ncbi:MAG: glycosyltransferase family 4 protein [Candidatus Spechtbacterales bacterium]
MKLLMITQKIDKDDDILGAYHEWARAIAGSFDKFSVLCLYEGKNELPKDIKVFSLGKENRESRIKYLKNFYQYIWKLRSEYDAVFVHMNPIYILFGWPIWRVLHKKIYLWFAHPAWNWQVKLAYILSDRVITSVPEAFHARGGKIAVIGQGIDPDHFRRLQDIPRDENGILSLGRISRTKRIHILLAAMKLLKEEGANLPALDVVGDPPEESLKKYLHSIQDFVKNSGLGDIVTFHESVPNSEAHSWYNRCGIFVNLSPAGYFDKTVLEAMACECLPLVSNKAYESIFPEDLHGILIFTQDDAGDLADKLKKVLELPGDKKEEIRKRLREVVIKNHSIYTLGERILKAISSQ